jgi:hypothetical protein
MSVDRLPTRMVVMTQPPAETRRLLRIIFDGDSVHGSLDDADRAHPFVGWLELLAAIQELRTDAESPGPAQTSP